MYTAENVIAVARGELGNRESPRNSNRTKYGAWYGMNGQPWCAIGQDWVQVHAGGPDMREVFTSQWASTLSARQAMMAKGRSFKIQEALPGDILILDFPGGRKYADHMELLIENHWRSKVFVTIGFNTGSSSQTNGGEVMQRSRSTSLISCVGRPYYNTHTPTAPSVTLPPPTDAMAKLKAFVEALIFNAKASILWRGSLVLNDARHDEVRIAQRGINNYLALENQLIVDGNYGPRTVEIVKFFQLVWGLYPDGEFGIATANRVWP